MRRYALLSILCAGVAAAEARVHYREVAQEAGIDFEHYNGAQGEYYYVETFGAGAAFFDADGDGWQDIYLINGAHLSGPLPSTPPINHLYRNAGDGTFADLTVASGVGDRGYGMGCTAGDFDNDGDQDLYATNFGPNVLLSNDGEGHFTDVTQIAGVGDGRWGTSTGFLDFDNDGDLDLFVANYVHFSLQGNIQCQRGAIRFYCEPSTYAPIGDVLYRNEGRRFVDVTKRMGIRAVGRGLGVAFADSDLDGDTDIYVANDGTPNFLYENQGTRFVEVGLRAGVQYNEDGHAEAGMGVDFGDFDNDGYADLFVTNYSRETNTLYWNDGRGRFADFTAHFGLGAPSYLPLGFGAKFMDYDNDGDLDLYVGNGHVVDNIEQLDADLCYAQPDLMLRNQGGAHFEEVSDQLGADFVAESVVRGAAAADWDNDGDLDLLATTVAGRPRLLRNDGGNRQHWIELLLVGAGQRDALGARVTVTAGGARQVRERQSGGSYLSSHDPRLHFGLGRATKADIAIRWPDGQVQTLAAVDANQIIRVVQPTR